MNAAMYNQQVGLKNPSCQRWLGYAYPYVKGDKVMAVAEDEKEKDLDVVDVDVITEDELKAKEPEHKQEQTIKE